MRMMPMTARSNLITMSPELLHKIEHAAQSMEERNNHHDGQQNTTDKLITVLEKTIEEASKELIIQEKYRTDKQIPPDHHVVVIDSSEMDDKLKKHDDDTYDTYTNGHDPDNHDTNDANDPHDGNVNDVNDSHDDTHSEGHNDDNSSVQLFDVSVDIHEATPQDSDELSVGEEAALAISTPTNRRSSKWSATVLFVASDVQLTVNLAELNLPDGFETAPKRRKDSEDKMSDRDSAVELQPMDNSDTNSDQPIKSDDTLPHETYSNGDLVLDLRDDFDKHKDSDNDSLMSNHSEHSEKDKIDDNNEDDKSSLDSIHPPKEDWGHKADYLLAVIGYAVDLSNVWRFPYLCYKNGGGAFIIPYFTVLIFGAMPIFFMEMAMGQYHREGPITVWKIVPMFKGIGYASCYMAYIVAFYYNVVIGWSFYYLFSSFTFDLPWKSCDHDWNSENCQNIQLSADQSNVTSSNLTDVVNSSVSSSYEFFERGMLHLHLSKGVDNLGNVRWQLLLCTLLTFTCLYFSLWKGVKSSGKVVYVTATMPYIILTILLIRGCLLPGAVDGIKYFITPNVDRLSDPNVWIDAAVQIMFSIGAGFGTHIAYASHNKFNNNCYADCLFTTAVNSFTSIFSGFVVFSYLGYMAARQQKDIDSVAQEGPGLVFIVYPEAIATLPGSSIWAVIFFLMLITLGMDSAFGGLESPLTGLSDHFYRVFRKPYFREVLTLLIVGSAFLFSIPCTTYGGMYVFRILDTFAAGTSILFTVLCEVVAIAWFYGIDTFCQDIHKMTGYLPGLYWRICWKYLSPTFLVIIVISSILHFKPLVYEGGIGTYVYPYHVNVIGWMIAASSMLIIPVYALYYLWNKIIIIVISSILHFKPLVNEGGIGTYVYPYHVNVIGWMIGASSMLIIPVYVLYYLWNKIIIIVISSILHFKPLVYEGGIGTYVYPYHVNVIGWMIAASSMLIIPVYALYYLWNKLIDLFIIVISSILHFKPLVYEGGIGTYVYPYHVNVIGWMIAASSMMIIPLYALYYLWNKRGTLKERVSLGISPKWEHTAIKDTGGVKRFKREHWVYI